MASNESGAVEALRYENEIGMGMYRLSMFGKCCSDVDTLNL